MTTTNVAAVSCVARLTVCLTVAGVIATAVRGEAATAFAEIEDRADALSIHRDNGGHSTDYRDTKRALEFVVAAAASQRKTVAATADSATAMSPKLQRWLTLRQDWTRDTDGPVISLGTPEQFDDTHIFAPAVARQGDRFFLWYCGSRGTVAQRVFRLGLATSPDGRVFTKHADNPVYRFGDGQRSVLTPCVLRDAGKLRMWFSSSWLGGDTGKHTLHESVSDDGAHWSPPSAALLENVYAPTIVRTNQLYQMWFVDVKTEPWIIRHAFSPDGRQWNVTEDPCLVIDQAWEKSRLFYPFVRQVDGGYIMWYGSYWSERPSTTALGFAVSEDGLRWHKHADNPVFRPDPNRPWESHYVTSQSILLLADGTFRMWYASRKEPPFVNKYFAINTAVWSPAAKPDNR